MFADTVTLCATCGHGENEVLPLTAYDHLLGHDFVPVVYRVCSACAGLGMTVARTGHAYEHFDQGDYDLVDCPACVDSVARGYVPATTRGERVDV